MSDGLNQVTLIGNLGSDPELKQTNAGAVLVMRIATTESYLDRNRQRQERTEWHTVIVWGNRAEGLARILGKGHKVGITGGLRTQSWEANDGTKRYRTEIHAQRVVLCGGGQRQSTASPPTEDRGSYHYNRPDDADDDIPF